MDDNKFFREATLRICGNLEIDRALRECLKYIRDFMPADLMAFVIHIPEEEVFETVAVARLNDSDTLPIRIPVPKENQAHLKVHFDSPRITIVNTISRSDSLAGINRQLGFPDGGGIIMEMVLAGKKMGALIIINQKGQPYSKEHERLLSMLNEPFGIALTNSLRYRKANQLKNLLADDKRYLEKELLQKAGEKIIGSDSGLKNVMELVKQVGPTDSPVLLQGETGAGKEVIAGAIHKASIRRDGPFIKVNCGAITQSLIDSELFGHEKGAFTGAVARKRGRFERAEGGTIFLDEFAELPPEAQTRFLRVLQDKEIERVGGERPIKVDCRIIVATNRNLDEMIRHAKFRYDLYYRIQVFPITIPPLRKRKSDIPALTRYFLHKKARELALPESPALGPGALDRLMAYHWPGNVRELENAIERALIINKGKPLTFNDLWPDPQQTTDFQDIPKEPFFSLDEAMARHIRKALYKTGGKVEGDEGAARILCINPGTLRQRMRKLGIPFGRDAKTVYHALSD
jgi:formate hydrogenlyase transcriptional activator